MAKELMVNGTQRSLATESNFKLIVLKTAMDFSRIDQVATFRVKFALLQLTKLGAQLTELTSEYISCPATFLSIGQLTEIASPSSPPIGTKPAKAGVAKRKFVPMP